MPTALDVITEFRTMGYYPQASATQSRTLFDSAYKYVMSRIEMRSSTVEIEVTADTATYDLPVTTWKTFDAYWHQTSDQGSWFPLKWMSIDMLNAISSGWRMVPSVSQPNGFYVTSGVDGNSAKPMMGLYPPPSVSSSAGYPKVVLNVTEYADLDDGDDIPTNLIDHYCILYRMCYLWAVPNDPTRKDYWRDECNVSVNENRVFIEDQQQGAPSATFISPVFTKMSRAK